MLQTKLIAATGVGAPWLSDTVRACQAFLGESVSGEVRELLPSTVRFLHRLPVPSTPVEVLTQRGLLLELALQYGHAAHLTFHHHSRPQATRCAFHPALCVEDWPSDASKSAAEAFRRWASRFALEFQKSHPLTCAKVAKEYLTEHFQERLAVSKLARHCGCSRKHLQNTFKTLTGFSIPQYQAELKITEALRLLAHTNTKIEAVAAEVGYRSKKDLYRAVRERVGCTPLQFRMRGDIEQPSSGLVDDKHLTVNVRVD